MVQIIYLHPHFTSPGGAGRMVLETGIRLARRGHDVHCICIRADHRIVGEAESEIKFHEIGGPLSSSLWFWIRFYKGCDRLRAVLTKIESTTEPTVIFPQVFPANWWAAEMLKHLTGMRCVWYCQEPSAFIHSQAWINALPWPKNWLASMFNALLCRRDVEQCRRFEKVLVNSKYSQQRAQDVYGYREDQCEIAYLGYAPEKFNSAKVESRPRWITCVAKLTRFKNVDRIIQAMQIIVESDGDDVQLHIVGTGDAEQELHQQAIRLGLTNHVLFHGRLCDSDMVALLRKSRAFCLASENEPFGLVAIEAMACGTPVIAVNNGGPQEIIGESNAGILVPEATPEEFASAIRKLIYDDEMFDNKSQAALRRAQDFGWEETVERLESIFVQCLPGFKSTV